MAIFDMGSHIAQIGLEYLRSLEILIFLLPLPQYWDYGMSQYLVYVMLENLGFCAC